MTRFHTRVKHSWAVLTGRICLPCDVEGMNFMVALTKTAASVAALSAAANNLISVNAKNASDLAAANATIESADSDTSASVDAITNTITAAAPMPPVAAQIDGDGTLQPTS